MSDLSEEECNRIKAKLTRLKDDFAQMETLSEEQHKEDEATINELQSRITKTSGACEREADGQGAAGCVVAGGR